MHLAGLPRPLALCSSGGSLWSPCSDGKGPGVQGPSPGSGTELPPGDLPETAGGLPCPEPPRTLSRSSSQSPVTSQKEGPAWPVGNPAGDSEKHHGARRGPQEERQLPGQDSRSPGLSTDDPFQPGLEESREQSQDNGRQAGSQQRGSEAAADGKPEAELQRVNAQLQLQVEALGRELESTLVQEAQGRREEQARLQQEAAQRCSSQAEELAELEARHGARLAEAEKRQQELAERLSQATHDAEQEAQAAAEALEEAERRLRAQEAERREYLAGAEAQELRHQQLLSRCQRLQEKLSASEKRLEETEAQVAALQSQGQREGPSGSPPLGPEEETAQRAALEARLRQAELQAQGLREKLERGLAEGRELEREREALLESAVSQGQSLAAARLQAQDLQKELAAQRERNASLQAKLEHAGRALMDKEEGARGLQEELEGQSAKLRDALAENAAVASRLAEAGAGFASEKAQLEARGTEERAGHERAVAELRRRLAECEEQRRAEREEKQQLQAVLTEKDAWEQTLARAAAELERAGGGDRPEAGDEEPLGLARGRGAAEEKAAGGAGPQTDKQVLAGEPPEDLGTAARPEQKPRKSVEEMVKHLTTHLEKAMGEAQQKGQLLTAKEEEAKHLAEQLGRAQQDGERFRLALERAQREAEEREKKHGGQLAEQQELVREVKGRLLELLREKDALWQKTEGIDSRAPSVVPQDLSLCARCSQDFGFLSRRYQCRLCQGTVCQACSVESGRRERCCLLCWQKRNFKGT
ncbi:pleckstrin [Platysternon megacephalum]|uniref:Pleckstrin n=1 Tax=Platysternon megacephalum TaxID=55544 RepID=A0A4D9EA36_9SAUR|nr:pleckstrin [Platysternon megacephalum]